MSTPIYTLADWAAAQASPWNGQNLNARVLEALIRGSVADRNLAAPPGSSADGAAYLVAAAATGAWAGHSGQMAISLGVNAANGWVFAPVATEGQVLWVDDENIRITYDGAAWVTFTVPAAAPEVVEILATDPNGSAITTGNGKAYFSVPAKLNGWNLMDAEAALTTTSSSGNPQVQVRNVTQAVDMLTTVITIDAGDLHSKDATTPPVIDAANDDVAYGDLIAIDIDTAGTGAKGLMVILQFEAP